MKLSVVSTLYKSKVFLDEFLVEIEKAIKFINIEDYELIFVNDGSPDDSLEHLISLMQTNAHIKIIDLSRNFGHHYAAYAGLKYAKGELTFLIDCDLEVSPNVLSDFYLEMNDSGVDVVYGVQKARKGGLLEKYLGGLFWSVFNYMSDIKVPKNVLTERLMNRNYLDSLLSLEEKNLFFAGNMYWVGYNQKPLLIDKKQRSGKSTYGLKRRVNLLIESITSFSDKPLRILFFMGVCITSISVLAILIQLVRKLITPDLILQGFTTLYILILLSLGIIISAIGLMSIYMSKVFKETKARPLYIVKQIIKKKDD